MANEAKEVEWAIRGIMALLAIHYKRGNVEAVSSLLGALTFFPDSAVLKAARERQDAVGRLVEERWRILEGCEDILSEEDMPY